jgi:hypothetical protein
VLARLNDPRIGEICELVRCKCQLLCCDIASSKVSSQHAS